MYVDVCNCMTWAKLFYPTWHECRLLKRNWHLNGYFRNPSPKKFTSLKFMLLFLLRLRRYYVSETDLCECLKLILNREREKENAGVKTLCQAQKTDFQYTFQPLQQLVFCTYFIIRFLCRACVLFAASSSVDDHFAHTIYNVVHYATRISWTVPKQQLHRPLCVCTWSWYNSFNFLYKYQTRTHHLEHQWASSQINADKQTNTNVRSKTPYKKTTQKQNPLARQNNVLVRYLRCRYGCSSSFCSSSAHHPFDQLHWGSTISKHH